MKQPSMWLDYHKSKSGELVVGIECDDSDYTFDGHFVCLFPRGTDEKDDLEATLRCQTVLNFMIEKGQIKRRIP